MKNARLIKITVVDEDGIILDMTDITTTSRYLYIGETSTDVGHPGETVLNLGINPDDTEDGLGNQIDNDEETD